MNELYRHIHKQDLGDEIKMIGLGIGNTPADVEYFKKKYEVPFPLFSDEDKAIHTALGKPRAPYFIGVRLNHQGSNKIFYSKLGGFSTPEKFLALMLKLSGIGQSS